MNQFTAYIFGTAACLAFSHAPHAQITDFSGSHTLNGEVSHSILSSEPPFAASEEYAQTIPVTMSGPSSASFTLGDSVFNSNIYMQSEWDADDNSVSGTMSKSGNSEYNGQIGDRLHPRYESEAQAVVLAQLESAGVPYKLTIDWDMLPLSVSGDGWGYSIFTVSIGDDILERRYGHTSGGSSGNISPDLGPSGSFVFEGATVSDSIKVTVTLYGPGNSSGNAGCVDGFCGFGSVTQQSHLNYELVVGDDALTQDSDSDAIADSMDNCLLIANPDQHDSNGDGYGNLCDPDLDNNGVVNFADYVEFATRFLATDDSPNWLADADLNNDGVINFGDIAIVSSFFLLPPGPSGTAP